MPEIRFTVNLPNNEEVLGKLKELDEKLKEAKSLADDLAEAVKSLELKID